MTEPIIYVNGEFVPQSQARISVLDHAVLYGDGVFETVVAWDGRIFKLGPHIDRFGARWPRSPSSRRSIAASSKISSSRRCGATACARPTSSGS